MAKTMTFKFDEETTGAKLEGYMIRLVDELIQSQLSTKGVEILLLEMLERIQGYLCEEFTEEEFSIMRKNIRSDFSIFCDTWVGRLSLKVITLNSEIQGHVAAIETRNKRIEDVERENDALRAHDNLLLDDLVKNDGVVDLGNYFKPERLIIAKLKAGQELDDSEIRRIESYLITKF